MATYFLPWHRWMMLQYENLLRQVDCKITLAFWDWSLVSAQPFNNGFWEDSASGFGGNGIREQSCVNTGWLNKINVQFSTKHCQQSPLGSRNLIFVTYFTGPFSFNSSWTLPRSAGGNCLQRVFLTSIPGLIPDSAAVARILAKDAEEFENFELMLRANLNNVIFFAVGGTMLSANNAMAPEFIPVHAFTDKIWAEWQAKGAAHLMSPFFLTQNNTMPGTNYRPRDFLRNDRLPGGVQVKYASPDLGNWTQIIEKLKEIAGELLSSFYLMHPSRQYLC